MVLNKAFSVVLVNGGYLIAMKYHFELGKAWRPNAKHESAFDSCKLRLVFITKHLIFFKVKVYHKASDFFFEKVKVLHTVIIVNCIHTVLMLVLVN